MNRRITKEELDKATRFGPFCAVRLLTDGSTIVKTGECIREVEAETMKFVKKHTSIPVPEVYSVYKDEESGHVCIVMEYVQGTPLNEAWAGMTDEEKTAIVKQLRGHFKELRQIKGTFIGAIDGSACDDQFFPEDEGDWGPYQDETAFNTGLTEAWSRKWKDPLMRLLCKIQCNTMQGHEIVLTHNDFAPRNILVQESRVVAILDWELSGYYPEYWEYCKAVWRPQWQSQWMKEDFVNRVLDPYLQEAAVILHTSNRW